MRLEDAGGASALCRDSLAPVILEALLPAAEREALESDPEAGVKAAIATVHGAFMDRFVLDAIGKRMRQVVLLGSGMDTRAYRLDVPPQLRIIEADEAAIHSVKQEVLEAAGCRTRCAVRRVDVGDLGAGTDAAQLLEAISPALDKNRAALFVLDGALADWAADLQASALAAVVAAAPDGSTIVGPAPAFDVKPLLESAGFGQVKIVVTKQLEKIYSRPVPEEVNMLVAMQGPGPPKRDANPGSSPREAAL